MSVVKEPEMQKPWKCLCNQPIEVILLSDVISTRSSSAWQNLRLLVAEHAVIQ